MSYLDQINHIAIIHDILQKHSSYNKECIYKLFTFIIPNAIASNDFPIYEAYELLGKKLIQKYKNKKIKIADNPNINMLNNTVTFSQDFFNFTKPTICPLY